MKHISIIVPETAVIEAVADPLYLFNMVNQFLASAGEKPAFEIDLVGLTKDVKLSNMLFSVHTNHCIHELSKTDLIIIPAISGDMKKAVELNQDYIPWMNEQYQQGAELASLCVGAFLLASTGLLQHKKCSTHWLYANEFRNMFPETELVDGTIITEEHKIYSSGGANSYWNLLLYLVEKYTSREMAVLASKYFAVDIDRNSQSAFMMFNGQKEHADSAIIKAQEYIESNVEKRISVEELACHCSIGRRSFERRFKKATKNTIVEYMQRVKIEAAKRSFESSYKNINEVMYDVGYSDTKAFRSLFKKLTGLTPIEYRNKFNKLA